MTDYTKLVEALRCKRDDCEGCDLAFFDNDEGWMCQYAAKDDDAADAIEALQKTLKAVQKNSGINFRMWEEAQAEVERLQAELPKRGEWKTTDAFPHRVYCSKCFRTYVPNDRWQIWVDNELPRNYCPNCGAKMEVQE